MPPNAPPEITIDISFLIILCLTALYRCWNNYRNMKENVSRIYEVFQGYKTPEVINKIWGLIKLHSFMRLLFRAKEMNKHLLVVGGKRKNLCWYEEKKCVDKDYTYQGNRVKKALISCTIHIVFICIVHVFWLCV